MSVPKATTATGVSNEQAQGGGAIQFGEIRMTSGEAVQLSSHTKRPLLPSKLGEGQSGEVSSGMVIGPTTTIPATKIR